MMTMKPCTTHPARTGLQVGQRYGLPVIAPVDDAGVFTEEAGPVAGLDAMTDGSKKVVDLLRDAGRHAQGVCHPLICTCASGCYAPRLGCSMTRHLLQKADGLPVQRSATLAGHVHLPISFLGAFHFLDSKQLAITSQPERNCLPL